MNSQLLNSQYREKYSLPNISQNFSKKYKIFPAKSILNKLKVKYNLKTEIKEEIKKKSISPTSHSISIYRKVNSVIPSTSKADGYIYKPQSSHFDLMNKLNSIKIYYSPIRSPKKLSATSQKIQSTVHKSFNITPLLPFKHSLEIGCQIDID